MTKLDELNNAQLAAATQSGGYSLEEWHAEHDRVDAVCARHVMGGTNLSYWYERASITARYLDSIEYNL